MPAVVKAPIENPYIRNVRREAEDLICTLRDRILGGEGLDILERFASSAPKVAAARDEEMLSMLAGDEPALERYGWHMRTIRAYIIVLRDGYIPAIREDPENHDLRLSALVAMAALHGQFQTMRRRIRYC